MTGSKRDPQTCRKHGCELPAAKGQVYCSREHAPFAKIDNQMTLSEVRKKNLDMTPADVERFQKRARVIARERGHPELAEDFAQQIFIAFARGWRSTLDQLFVDFLRDEFGSSRTPSGRARAASRASTFSLDETSGPGENAPLFHDLIASPERHKDAASELHDRLAELRCGDLFDGLEAEFYELHFLDQLSQIEIANRFGLTESRVCQVLGPMRRRIREHAELEEIRDRIENDDSFGTLEVQWITL